jgi:hypothetical protein
MPRAATAFLLVLPLLAAGCVGDDLAGGLATGATDLVLPPLPPLEDVQRMWTVHAIEATLEHDPETKQAHTLATYAFENRFPEALPHMRFVTAGMTVVAITDASGAPVEFKQDDLGPSSFGPLGAVIAPFALWNVTMPQGGVPGTQATLVVEAEGWEEIVFLGGGSAGGDAPVADLNSFAQLAVIPIAEARGAPWLNVTMTRPTSWSYALDAFPAGEAIEEGGRVTQKHSSRTAAFVIVAASDWNKIEETVDGIQVVTYYHPDMLVQAQSVHEVAKRALRVMSTLTGPYPYPSLTTAPAKLAGNAFSSPSLTVLGLNYFRGLTPLAPVQQGRDAPWIAGAESQEEVLVHEITHNWWGSQVTANNSDATQGIRDDYIIEGFTTYLSEIAYYEHVYGRADAAASAEAKWRGQQQERLEGTDAPITAQGGDHYERAALALRALHAHYVHAGKETAFLQTFRDLLATHALNAGGSGILRHEEVVRAFSDTYGGDLSPFFDAWFLTTELPDIAVEDADTTGATLANHGALPAPVEIRFRDAGGAENHTWIWLEPGESLRLEAGLPLPLASIHADPNWRLDETDKTNNVWGATSPVTVPMPL